jgi:ABC-type glycerol-3-phosphate transport system permease component
VAKRATSPMIRVGPDEAVGRERAEKFARPVVTTRLDSSLVSVSAKTRSPQPHRAGAMAFCSVAMLPPLVVFILAQRQVIAGLTTGGTTG